MEATKYKMTIKKNDVSMNMNKIRGGGRKMFYLKSKMLSPKVCHINRQTEIFQHKVRFNMTNMIREIGARKYSYHRHWV